MAPHQYGFREGYATSLVLATIHNKIISNVDDKKITCAICLDFAKAFDTVDHFIFINELRRYGIRGSALQLLKSYLSNHKQHRLSQWHLGAIKLTETLRHCASLSYCDMTLCGGDVVIK